MQEIKGWSGGLIKAFVDGVEFEHPAQIQVHNVAAMSFVTPFVAVMPDVHWGMGATVGSVIPTKGAIIPAAVGVDIGCVDAETEYLTPTGWKRFDAWTSPDEALVYDVNKKLAWFEKPERYIRRTSQGFNHIHTKYGINHAVSDDHKLLTYQSGRNRRFDLINVTDAASFRYAHHDRVQGVSCRFNTTPENIKLDTCLPYTDAELRVIVMTAADTAFEGASAYLQVTKERKYRRALAILDEAGCEIVSDNRYENGRYAIRFRPVTQTKPLDQLWGASVEQLKVIADEVLYWDGNHDECCFYTRKKVEADFVQWAFLVAGKRAVMRLDEGDDMVIDYRVFAHNNTKVGVKSVPRTDIGRIASSDGFEYCFTVSTGFFLTRRGGVTIITGNCGMMAFQTTLTASDLPDNLFDLRSAIEAAVPHGRTDNGGVNDRGAWSAVPERINDRFGTKQQTAYLRDGLYKIVQKNPTLERAASRVRNQFGTLGGGNHFIEICLDTEQTVWVMLHSGSRGIGNRIGSIFIEKAKQLHGENLPDKNLAWLDDGTPEFADYIEAMLWAQDYARENRKAMMQGVLGVMHEALPSFGLTRMAVNCHHNFTEREDHFGETLWVTRKGAVRARKGELGIIPGSMGARSYIVRGKGNPDSFESCSHGAGRRMSRGKAKQMISVADHVAATEGVECRKDTSMLDESPAAYKDIDAVMAAQADLVEIVATLKQVLCVKG